MTCPMSLKNPAAGLSITLLYIIATLCLGRPTLLAQGGDSASRQSLRIMSYNVENLFDTIDDPHKRDEEFTPSGAKQWDKWRYQKKLQALSEVISGCGGAQWPALVGLMEVENSQVLSDLTERTGLRKAGYSFAVSRSQDERGINVALMWREGLFRVDSVRSILPQLGELPERKTRDILYVSGWLKGQARLHVFVLHLPSRRGGVQSSDPYRLAIAQQVGALSDSIVAVEGSGANILIMGDMNASADEAPLRDGLRLQGLPSGELEAHASQAGGQRSELYCATEQVSEQGAPGSYCYRGVWGQIDHIILSRALFSSGSRLRYVQGSAQNYAPTYLHSPYSHAGHATPLATYAGPYYRGGYSDHYPVFIDLELHYAITP